jgi:hypothetical protein
MHARRGQTGGGSDHTNAVPRIMGAEDRIVSGLQRRSRLVGGSANLAKFWRGHATSLRPFLRLEAKIASTSSQASVPASQSAMARFTLGVLNSPANWRQIISEADMSAPFVEGLVAEFMSRNIDSANHAVKQTRRDFTNEFRELRALLKTALEVANDLEHRGAGEGSRPSSPVAPDGPAADSHRKPQPEHYSVGFDTLSDDGFVNARCSCCWDGGRFPTAEDACDALMDHSYEAAGLAESNWCGASSWQLEGRAVCRRMWGHTGGHSWEIQ